MNEVSKRMIENIWTFRIEEFALGGHIGVRAWLYAPGNSHIEPRLRPTGRLKSDLCIYVKPPNKWELFWNRNLTFRKKVDAAREKLSTVASGVCLKRDRESKSVAETIRC